ncbi:response regulator [Pseudoduganella sp. UC29_106]|uniref:response regulator n=1 Tax=Pseudoduganella sp. UC29_106 TaxID=3374553 RepID=UPI00375744D3
MESIASGNQALADQDWSRCEAGPPEHWPPTLRLAVDILLDLPLPAVLMWGRKQIMFINGAYAHTAGSNALSVPGGTIPLMPPAVWNWNPDALEQAWQGQSLRFPSQALSLWRGSGPETRSFDLTYTPLRDERGAVQGLLCTLAPPSAVAAPLEPQGDPMRILVVEDNLDAQYLVCEMLRAFGHTVNAVARAEDALATLQREEFDVLFTDVSLPGMSGVDLARQALRERPALRIVFASGYSQALTSQLEFPAVSMQKPYDIEQLQQALAQVASVQP